MAAEAAAQKKADAAAAAANAPTPVLDAGGNLPPGAGAERSEEDSEKDAEAEALKFCAQQAYWQIRKMRHYTSECPPFEYLGQLDTSSSAAAADGEPATQYVLLAPWQSADGVVLPAKAVGTLIKLHHTECIKWSVVWSGWPLLVRRLQQTLKSVKLGVPLPPAVWAQVAAIVHLIYKVCGCDVCMYNGSGVSEFSHSMLKPRSLLCIIIHRLWQAAVNSSQSCKII